MLYKRCSRCGKRMPIGVMCECMPKRNTKYHKTSNQLSDEKQRQKRYDMEKRNKESAKFYSSGTWQKLRETVKQKYRVQEFEGIDVYSFFKFNKIEIGRIMHHIRPVKDYPELKLRADNLILLTDKNHEIIHKRMDEGEADEVITELEKYVKEWERLKGMNKCFLNIRNISKNAKNKMR